MDGIEATCAIRKLAGEKAGVHIVGLSAHAGMEINKCFEAGMNQFISKPFHIKELLGAVK